MTATGTVLMIDDAPALHDVLRTCLTDQQLQLHFARTTSEGFRLAHELRPDVLLLDIAMPCEDGFSPCKKLKEDPATRDIQVIFLTALCSSSDKRRGLEIGAIDYITKPFDLIELKA